MGEWSNSEIAEACGLPSGDIAAFAAEHAAEISEVRAALAGQLAIETAGLWITKKQFRLAEIQADFDDTAEAIRALGEGELNGIGSRRHYNLNRIRLALLRAVAEELGERRPGPKVGEDDVDVVHYVIEGPEAELLT